MANVAPTLFVNGAATVREGQTYTLNLASTNPGDDTISQWVINWGDGPDEVFEGNPSSVTHTYADGPSVYAITARATDDDGTYEANGATVIVENIPPAVRIDGAAQVVEGFAQTVEHTFLDGDARHTIRVLAVDPDGVYEAVNAVEVAVNDVPPVLSLSGEASVLEGSPYTLSLLAEDPGQEALRWTINWGDGSPTQTIPPTAGNGAGVGVELDHLYTTAGDYTVQMTATDKDGATSAVLTRTVTVRAIELQGSTLAIGGATTADDILVNPGSVPDEIKVRLNGEWQVFAGVARFVIFAQPGDDLIQLAGGIKVPSEVYGDADNDRLIGSNSPNVLVGGAGDDWLTGGSDRDILIGGAGADWLEGWEGEDLLIAALFLDGRRFKEVEAGLERLRSDWLTSDPYQDRAQALAAYLAERLTNDLSEDTLVGGDDLDLFFASLSSANKDTIRGTTSRETKIDLAGF